MRLQAAVLAKPQRWETPAALQFSDPIMVADYAARDPYCPEAFAIVRRLMVNDVALDVGSGSGDVTIPLAQITRRVDALDISVPMLELAQSRPGGNVTNIHWMLGKLEELALTQEYGVVTAGDSIHWMDWPIFFPALKRIMAPGAVLVILERGKSQAAWRAEQRIIQSEYYTEPDSHWYDPVMEIEKRGFFELLGDVRTTPVTVQKSVKDYVREVHSRNGYSRSRLGLERTRELDARLETVLWPHLVGGLVQYETFTRVRWGLVLN